MVLSFKPIFREKILKGSKIHTIRKDPNRRWQSGRKIHFATGVRTKNYECFKQGFCIANQAIQINPDKRKIWVGLNGGMQELSQKGINLLIQNDGFDSEQDFWNWFNEPFLGMIVHWTNFYYS